MRYLIPRLLTLPVSDDIRAEWTKQLADQPEIPLLTEEGETRILPAEEFGKPGNMENPELYTIFPFHLFTLATASEAELQIGINTFHAPANTVVECEVRDGKVVNLVVMPESRRKDVKILME